MINRFVNFIKKYYNKIMTFYTTSESKKNEAISKQGTGIWLDINNNEIHFYKDGQEVSWMPYQPLTFDDLTEEQKAQLKGEKGDKGDKGDKGATGAIGPQGPKGDTGATGATGATGTFDDSILDDYVNKDELTDFLGNVQNYVEDTGEYPTSDDIIEWEDKQDVLEFDYDLDGLFTEVDLYLPRYIQEVGVTNLGDKFNSTNLTYNGLSLDINGDHEITVTDTVELTRNCLNWKNASKVKLKYNEMKTINVYNIIKALANSKHHYPTYDELKDYLKILKYDYDGDGIIGATDQKMPLMFQTYFSYMENDPKFNTTEKTYNGCPLLIEDQTDFDTGNIQALNGLINNAKEDELLSALIDSSVENDNNDNKIRNFIQTYRYYPSLKDYYKFFYAGEYRWRASDLVCEYTTNDIYGESFDQHGIELFNPNIDISTIVDNIWLINVDLSQTEISLSDIGDGVYLFDKYEYEPATYKFKFNLKDNTKIPASMFEGCADLKTVVLPTNVTLIKNKAFKGCNNLKNIYMQSENVIDWTDGAGGTRSFDNFKNNSELKMCVTAQLLQEYKDTYNGIKTQYNFDDII